MYKSILSIICFSLVLAFSVSAQTDSFLKTYRERIEKNPNDVDFSIKFKNDQTKFHQGEIISIELKFTTSTPNFYNFLNRTYDRSGRLHLDGFVIDKKEKTFDPLYDYFYRGWSRSGGGLYNVPTLGSNPQTVNYELNEYLSFKEPGKYRLYINSPRISLKIEGKNNLSTAFGGSSIPLTSNILEFEILPADAKWQEEKFAEAVEKDCKLLRYLGTKAAAKEMLIRFSREDKRCEFDNYIGLYGSPERKFIVDEMEKMLVSPDYAVTNNFFQILLRLDFFLNNPETKRSESNPFGLETKAEKEINNAIKLRYLEKFSKALPNKNENVFMKSLETFFSFHAEGEKTPSELTNALTNSFSKLSRRTQWIILQNGWDKLKNPAMLPVLQTIYNDLGRAKTSNSKTSNAEPFADHYEKELLNLSIKGIYELAPNIGKQIILDELRHPNQRVYTYILGLLPKAESPETENLLLEKLSGENLPADALRSVFMLIDHYETPKLISKLRQTYANKIDKIECGARITLLQIFLKSDLEFGTERLGEAAESNVEKGCVGENLANIIKPHWSPEIERIVLSLLENENTFIFSNAAQLLGKHGSIETRDKIWKRFERFNKEEQSKEDFAEKKDVSGNWQLFSAEDDFAVALSESPNWRFDLESNKRLSGLCLYSFCKDRVEKLNKIFAAPAKIEISFDEEKKILFSVYQYKNMPLDAMKKKLEQFSPDTTFTWIFNAKNPNDEKNFQEIKEFVENRKMNLVK